MKWKLKAILQKIFSGIPGGEKINFLLTKFAKQLPASDDLIQEKIRIAKLHLKSVISIPDHKQISDKNFYEFGAGWELIIPVAFNALGVRHQTIIDIDPLLRLELVNNTLARIPSFLPTPEPYSSITSVTDLDTKYGIRYIAPSSVTVTGLPDNSFDVITNTDTLEHVKSLELLDILRECFRILRPGGVMSSMIDMRDHFSYFDNSINPYNFLRYSVRAWSKYNSAIHYQNRLRAIDHKRAFEQAGFTITTATSPDVTAEHVQMLHSIPLAKEFTQTYSENELAVQGIHIVAVKPR